MGRSGVAILTFAHRTAKPSTNWAAESVVPSPILAAEAVHQNIVVVSHVSPIKASVAWALGTGDETTWRLFLGQASICRVATTLDSARLIEFNVTAHLDGLI